MIQVPYVKTAMHNHSRLGSDVIVGRRFELPEALSFEEKFGPDDQFAAPPTHRTTFMQEGTLRISMSYIGTTKSGLFKVCNNFSSKNRNPRKQSTAPWMGFTEVASITPMVSEGKKNVVQPVSSGMSELR